MSSDRQARTSADQVAMSDAEREVLAYWHSFMSGVHVPFAFVRICKGDWQAAAMLAQLFYWFRPDRDGADKTSIVIDGRRYVARRHTEWQELELSAFEAKRAAGKLANLGLIDVQHRMFNGMRTCHFRPCFSAIKAILAPTGGSTFAPTGGGKKPPTGRTDLAPTIKEKTTAKTTAETTKSKEGAATPPTADRRPTQPRPPRALGQGSTIYRDMVKLTPNAHQRALLDAAFERHGERHMRDSMARWLAHGWNPRNVPGMVDHMDGGDKARATEARDAAFWASVRI